MTNEELELLINRLTEQVIELRERIEKLEVAAKPKPAPKPNPYKGTDKGGLSNFRGKGKE